MTRRGDDETDGSDGRDVPGASHEATRVVVDGPDGGVPDDPPDAGVPDDPPDGGARRRPVLERIGMAAIAIVLAALFAAIALAAFAGGEPFLGAMAGIGCLMTLWVGGLTLIRG